MESISGFKSLFPMSDIAVMGFLPVLLKLPSLIKRIKQTAKAVIKSKPDLLVIIDSPDFTHRVAKKIRQINPDIPILNYVSPTVWAWREGRARKMRPYVDHILALLPFEPAAHLRLGGPVCTYIGHPLIDRLNELKPNNLERAKRNGTSPIILVLPGSRRSEVRRLMPVLGKAVALLAKSKPNLKFVLPSVAHVKQDIVDLVKDWPVKPDIIDGEAAKLAAFRTARAAMAASGTVTLELALAEIPMVTAYKVSKLEEIIIRALVKVPSAILPNIILDQQVIPEFLQENCTGENLSEAVLKIISDSNERQSQIDALKRVLTIMQVEGADPNMQAAKIALSMIKLD